MQKKSFKIRDTRKRGRYTIDDAYIDGGFAAYCGLYSTAVYNSLCRHADSDQECFPSLDLMMKQHGIGSHNSLRKGIKNLQKCNIINVVREYDPKTKRQKNNVYVLIDSSEWTLEPMSCGDSGADVISCADPVSSGDESRCHEVTHKDTHIKDTHNKVALCSAEDEKSATKCEEKGCGNDAVSSSDEKHYCKLHMPMDLNEFIAWCKSSEQKHIRIIGEWAETVKPQFRTYGQWTVYIKRFTRIAKELEPFDHDQLEAGFDHIEKGIKEGWLKTYTLETLYKFVTGEKI